MTCPRAKPLSPERLPWFERFGPRSRPCWATHRSAASFPATSFVSFDDSRKRGKERQAEKRQKGKLKVGVDIPTREEIKAIVEAAKGRWRPILLTAIFTGLRASELRGLRWADVDIEKRELHVRQRADRYSKIGKPKSDAGERTVPLTPIIVNTLREWKLACPKSEHGLVFPTGVGNVEAHSNIVHRGLAPTLVAAGVAVPALDTAGNPLKGKDGEPIMLAKYTGLHAFRHFYASWCINRRAEGGLELPAKVVQERLGHSSDHDDAGRLWSSVPARR